jgi:hypothetical protein
VLLPAMLVQQGTFLGFPYSSERRASSEGGKDQRYDHAGDSGHAYPSLPVRVARLIVSRFRSYGITTQIALFSAYAGLAWAVFGIGAWRWRGGWRGLGLMIGGLLIFLPLIWLGEYGM